MLFLRRFHKMKENKPFKYKNSREYLRALINRAYLSISLPFVLFGWLYLESTADNLYPQIPENMILLTSFLVFFLMFILVIIGYIQSSRLLRLAQTKAYLNEKILLHQEAITRKFIYFSIAALVISIGLYITANELISVLFAGMIIIFSINNPTLRSIVRDLQLRNEEKDTVLKVENFE